MTWKHSVLMLGALSAAGAANLLVLSKGDHTLAIVDAETQKVLARVPSGDDPHEVAASADGKMAFISNYGSGGLHTLTVVDLAGRKNLPVVDLGALYGPHGLYFAGGKVWFTAEGSKAIGRYDPAANKVDIVLGTGQNRTHMVYLTADQNRILTTNVQSGTVSIIDKTNGRTNVPTGDWNETVVAVGRGDEGFDVSPDGKEAWVANAGDGTISVIDLGSKTVTATIQSDTKSANRLKFTPDGKQVLVSMLQNGDVVVLDGAGKKVVKRVPVGKGAAGIEMNPDGSRAYVACTPDSYVAVIDLKTLTVTGHIDAGKQPDGMAWVR